MTLCAMLVYSVIRVLTRVIVIGMVPFSIIMLPFDLYKIQWLYHFGYGLQKYFTNEYLFGVLNVYQVKKRQKMTEINDNYYSVHSQIFVIFSTYPNNAVIAPNIN